MPEDRDQDAVTARLLALVDDLRRHPVRAMWLGVALQAVALGVAGWAVWHETRRETAAAEATKYLWRLGWHDALHHMPWLAVMIGCLLLYVVGALLFAIRFAPHHAGRVLAILLVLVAGLVTLGAAVLLLVLVGALLEVLGVPIDVADLSGWFPRRRRRREQRSPDG